MQPLSLTSPSSSPLLPATPSSPSLSTTNSPTPLPSDLSSAFQLAQTRARQKQEQLDTLHQLIHFAIVSTFTPLPPSTSPTSRAERRIERKAVARVVMPMVFKTELFKRWKRKGGAGLSVEGGGVEGGDDARLLREVLEEGGKQGEWTLEQRKDMLHFMLDAMALSHPTEAGGAPPPPPVSLVEAMEGSMTLYHALLSAQQRLTALEAAVKASSASSTPSLSSASSASATSFASSALSPSLPSSMSSEVTYYLQQHARDEREKAELRQQVREYRQLLEAPAPSSQVPTLSSLLSSSWTSAGSLLALAAVVAWTAYAQLRRELKKRDGVEGVARSAVSSAVSLYQQVMDWLMQWL